ncbi:hypothetical protein AYW79_05210 [Ferroacidibacillus organovorans]|uniref:Ribosome biogenesis GTPase A n=1 Tax=Ferroacidibacillus organovorans TaxID=1765683 RepID=A0A853KC41_9BACL|nr:ribosome biogenesis GTPase YlqF [Ferroacidibacillus organovorans]OAG94417.1 hypothetical protein AYW79_05210 [Ferroacidibacillus organovorans]
MNVSIQWFPGHMAKAKREIQANLSLVDVVIELRDARLPESSGNPLLSELLQQKIRVLALTKADLADPSETQRFCSYYKSVGMGVDAVIPVNIRKNVGLKSLKLACEQAMESKFERMAKRGIRKRAVRAMVVGIPNVGKSSLINAMAGRSVAKTGDRPGVTQSQQWIKLAGSIELLDTPGLLWPKFEDRDAALRLAWSGAIKSSLLRPVELALALLTFMNEHYPIALESRYGVKPFASVNDEQVLGVLEQIGMRRGALRSGGQVDDELAAQMLLRDYQTGLLGPMTLEKAPSVEGQMLE